MFKLSISSLVTMLTLVATMVISTSPAFSKIPGSREVSVNISSAIIPSRFDRHGVVSVIFGYFPNSCYSSAQTKVEHKSLFTHEIMARAHLLQGVCLPVLVPFTEEVQLGAFTPGHHILRYHNGDGTYFEKTLDID